MKILIHSGHNSDKNTGATGLNNYLEDKLNNDIAFILANTFEDGGWTVIREFEASQKSYDEIIREANLSQCDIFITLHSNYSSNPEARGFEIYYCRYSPKGLKLANSISASLLYNKFYACGEPVKSDDKTAVGYIRMLHKTNMPAILIEACFLSNKQDLEMMLQTENRIKFCKSVYKGVENNFI